MTFTEPQWLWLFIWVPVFAVLFGVLRFRRKQQATRYAATGVLASIAPRASAWRRYVVTGLAFLSFATLIVASAKPFGEQRVPREQATIMLAIDASQSMRADDVEPSRMAAAREAAHAFTADIPPSINVGLVVFAGTASIVVPPTTDRDAVNRAVDNIDYADATAIGEAIFASLKAFDMVPGETPDNKEIPRRIVLLSDGKTTTGRPDAMALEAAEAENVPIDTVAVGTPRGRVEIGGQVIPVPVADDSLVDISDATGGSHFSASSANQLTKIYQRLGSVLGYDTEPVDRTAWWLRMGVALLGLTMLLSLWWYGRAL